MTVRGDQQVEGESFTASDLYAPVLKALEARLILAISAAEGCLVYKTDTSQWEMMRYIPVHRTFGPNPYPKVIAFIIKPISSRRCDTFLTVAKPLLFGALLMPIILA